MKKIRKQAWLLVGVGLVILVFVAGLGFMPNGLLFADDPAEGPGGGQDPSAPALGGHERAPLSIAAHGAGDDILMITFDGNGVWAPNSLRLHDNLVFLGYNVTHLLNPACGTIGATLPGTFTQVWLFDINHFNQICAADAGALAAWYAAHSKGNIIVDARSYGSWYEASAGIPVGGAGAFELPVTENFAHEFSLRCGGLYIGTDHDPSWTTNGNPVLTAMGYGTVSGIHGAVTVGTPVPGHVLLNSPNVINLASVHAFASPGIPPTGVQGDGTNLQVLLHNTSESKKPLTSFSLASNFCAGDYLGYKVREGDDKFQALPAFLRDQFVKGDYRVENPDRLYTPADKEFPPHQANLKDVADQITHLKRYRVKGNKVLVKQVLVDSEQFGKFVVTAKGPYRVLVPTQKALPKNVFTAVPPPLPGNVDHYLCYRILKGQVNKKVSLADQFGISDYKVKELKWLCNPVEKTIVGSDGTSHTIKIQHPDRHLLCLDVEGPKQDVTVLTKNQFGVEVLRVKEPRELCVPASKTLATSPVPSHDTEEDDED